MYCHRQPLLLRGRECIFVYSFYIPGSVDAVAREDVVPDVEDDVAEVVQPPSLQEMYSNLELNPIPPSQFEALPDSLKYVH